MNTESLPDLGFDWKEIWTMLQTTGVDFGINVVTAIVVFFVGKWVVTLVVNGLMKAMEKGELDITLRRFIGNLARILLMVFVVIAAINQLGVQTASLIALLGAAGLAVGLALQGSLSNFAAGVLIVLFRPYKVGDWIEGGGISGAVDEVQILTTVLKTGDNKRVIVPNSQIMGTTITNYSANDTRRVDLVVGVSYRDDIDTVRKELQAVVAADDRVLDDPEVTIAVSELAASSVNFVVRPWVRTADYWGVYFDLTEAIKKRFDEVGISIPFPQQDVYIHNVAAD
ncbi:MAG TPA: mechanosensitive ion channel domain-containing protein [Woeseiaceae bacterium]|nr:mechanosensitive ion channel domain-containing protein [Woeseiaceae bacterium]